MFYNLMREIFVPGSMMVKTILSNKILLNSMTHIHAQIRSITLLTFSFWVLTVSPPSSLGWSGVPDSSWAAPPACQSPPVSHLWCRGSRQSACRADPPLCSPSSRACWHSLSWRRLPVGRLLSIHLHPVQNQSLKWCSCYKFQHPNSIYTFPILSQYRTFGYLCLCHYKYNFWFRPHFRPNLRVLKYILENIWILN